MSGPHESAESVVRQLVDRFDAARKGTAFSLPKTCGRVLTVVEPTSPTVQRRSFVRRDTLYPPRSRLRRRRAPSSLTTVSPRESPSFLPAIAQTHAEILRDLVEKLKNAGRERHREIDGGTVESMSDDDLAKAAARALDADDFVPFEDLDLTVSNGRVTISGHVDWQYQKDDAERIVSRLPGVKRVSNLITVNLAPRR
jgi:hypothetical protein